MSHMPPAPNTMAALVAIFGAFPGMGSRAERERYLPMVADDLGVRLDVQYSGDMRRDIEAMLSACAAHWGGVWALVEALEIFYDNPEVRRLRMQVGLLLPEPVLLAQERAQLTRLLQRMEGHSGSWLHRAYQVAVPPLALPLDSNPENLLDVAQRLEDYAPSAAVVPLLVFLDVVLHNTANRELSELLEEVARRYAIPPDERRAAVDAAVTRMNERPVLIARLRPEPEPDAFWLHVYLQWGSLPPEHKHSDEAPGPLSRARRVLDRLLHEQDDLRGLPLTIEFVLPCDLLSEPVDAWQVGEPPHQLGHTYPVVVRPPDRHFDTANLPAWEQKWRWVQTQGNAAHPDAVYWSPTTDADQISRDLAAEIRRVCLVLPVRPSPVRHDAVCCLRSALAAGVPAVLWTREDRDPADIEGQFVSLSRAHPVQQLAHLVLDLRLESDHRDADQGHIGKGLTLLWDDFARNPPRDMDLAVPQRPPD